MPVIAKPVTESACCPSGCGALKPIRPEVFLSDTGECTAEPMGIIGVQGQDISFEWVFRDSTGAPVDLEGCSAPVVQFKMQEIICRTTPAVEANCTINNLVPGAIRLTLSSAQTVVPGVYEAQFGLTVNENSTTLLRFMNRGYIIIESSMFSSAGTTGPQGPPPVSEILMAVQMGDPHRSTLLDKREWSVAEIAQMLARPIEIFNAMNPPIGVYFSTSNFPLAFRYDWRDATVGELMKVAAMGYMRDDMAYQGGSPGAAFADKAKWDQYYKIGCEKVEQFRNIMLGHKVSFNMRGGYGFLGTPYSYLNY